MSGSLSTTVLPFARLAVAALVAPQLGATLGLALWRQATIGRLAGARVRVVPVVFGVFVGCVAGKVASFSGTATTRWGQVGSLLPPAILMTGATALVAGHGELWEQVGGGLRRARGNWVPAVVVSTILFGVALWIGGHLRLAIGTGGWHFASALVASWMKSPAFAILVLAVAVAVAHARALRSLAAVFLVLATVNALLAVRDAVSWPLLLTAGFTALALHLERRLAHHARVDLAVGQTKTKENSL